MRPKQDVRAAAFTKISLHEDDEPTGYLSVE